MSMSSPNQACWIWRHVINVVFCIAPTPTHTALQIHRHVKPLHRQSLSQLMNGPVREKLGIIPKNVTWGGTVVLTCTVLEEY